MKWNNVTKPFKKLLVSQGGSTAGRNNAGRITIFHRGGGAKRLQRKIDLKRSTSSMGVVERIEYDPNRSSRLALVRWIEGVHPTNQRNGDKDFSPPQKAAEPIATEVVGQFPLACLAPPRLMGGNVVSKESGGKISNVKDVFVSAFGSKRAKGESVSSIPRMAVAGAKPSVFAPKNRAQNGDGEQEFSLSDVQMWRKDSRIWDHKLKRKAAVPWLSFVNEEPVGLAKAAQIDKSSGKSSKKVIHMVDRAPLTYILASDKLEEGKIVMNYDWSKRPTRN